MPPKRTQLSLDVTARLLQMGFPAAFAQLVGEQLNTDFTARMMLGYLHAAQPPNHGGGGGRDAGHPVPAG